MGIDIYAEWDGQTEAEHEKQISSWLCAWSGDAGYLREAYCGGPYATRFLVAEAFENGEARIPAASLRERLPHTLALAEERERKFASEEEDIERTKQSYRDFVALCERAEDETGRPVRIVASY